MSKTLLCQQCKVMLEGPVAGDRSDGQAIWFQHHPDAKSVRQALELPCRICSFAWVVEGNSFAQFDDMTDAMQGILQISSQDDNVISLCFFLKEGECNSRHVALGPYSSMCISLALTCSLS